MRKWALLAVAALVSLELAGCQQGVSDHAVSAAPASEARQTVAPLPTNTATAVPPPTSSPLPPPFSEGPTQVTPEPPKETKTAVVERRASQEKTDPPVSAVEIERGNTDRREIALTFDAGASSAPTPRILEVLEKHKVPATIFLTGQWAESNPGLVRQMASRGYEFANHSYSHPEFTKLTKGEMQAELERTEAIVQKLTGKSTRPFFRPPFGNRDTRVREVLAGEGYLTVYWTLDSTDWRPEGTASSVRERVVRLASSGFIVVLHLGSEVTAQALEEIIVRLRENGYSLVTLSRLLSP